MQHPTPAPLSPDKEAIGQAIIAEFEARQELKRRLARRRAWRTLVACLWVAVIFAFGVYAGSGRMVLSTANVCFLLAVFAATSTWTSFSTQEEISKLREELDELKSKLQVR